MSEDIEEKKLIDVCADLHITIESSKPSGAVDISKGEDGKTRKWPHIRYTVVLKRHGLVFWSGPYKLGVGHVKSDEPPPATEAECDMR